MALSTTKFADGQAKRIAAALLRFAISAALPSKTPEGGAHIAG